MTAIEWPPLAIGLALAVALFTALWKAARMRGDANREWSSRISVVEAGLSERAIGSLSVLRRKIDRLIGGLEVAFDPTSATADPALLLKSVRQFEKCISARRRARRYFKILLSLQYFAGLSLVLLLGSDGWWALHSSKVKRMPHLEPAIVAALVAGIVLGILVMAAQWYLQHKLTDAEMLSQEANPSDD